MTTIDRHPASACLALLAGIALALAAATAQAVFIVNGPWVRPAGADGAADVYMTLTSTEGATLVTARSDIARDAKIAGTGAAAGKGIVFTLRAGQTVMLKPGGVRIRLIGVKRALSLGDRVPLVLTIEGADGARQEIPVDAEVRHHSALDDHLHGHAH